MATKKSAPKKSSTPTLFDKLSDRASQVKDTLIQEKNHLAEIAGDTFEAVKEKIKEFRAKKPAPKKKAATRPVKKSPAKSAKKSVKKVAKKAATAKKKSVAAPAKKKRK